MKNTISRLERHRTWVLVVIFLLAVGVRAGVTLELKGNAPVPAGSDAISYTRFAQAIVHGNWIARPVSYREVGYPLFLSLVYRVAGDSPLAGRLANALLGGLTCVLVLILAERLFGFAVGLAAGLWSVVGAQLVFYNAFLLRESLVTLLLVATLLMFVRATRAPTWKNAAGAALGLVLLVHTDARFLFHVPFLLGYFFVSGLDRASSTRTAAAFLLVFVVAMVPWQYRNYLVYDHFVLVNTRTLEIGGSAPASADAAAPSPPAAPRGEKRVLTGFRRLLYEGTEFYRIFRFRGETRNNSTAWERPWSLTHNLASILTYGILVPFFVYGAWVVVRRRWRSAYILVIPVVAHTILHLIKWGRPRYRTPIDPIIIILGVFGLFYAIEKRRPRGLLARR